MKIDCPHCGVHGSIDDSFAGKKLRCPKCSKVFLPDEDILPEVDDTGMMRQEISPDNEPVSSESAAQGLMATEAEELVEPEDETFERETEESEEITEEELPEIQEEDSLVNEAVEEDDDVFDLMDGEGEEESSEFETCSGCGESLSPDFLETVGSKRYCALCLPDVEEEAPPEDSVVEDVDVAQDEDLLEVETDSVQALMEDDDVDDEEDSQKTCSVCGEKFHPDFLQEVDSKLYCGICQPEVDETTTVDGETVALGAVATAAVVASATDSEIVETEEAEGEELQESIADFTVGELLKEAWQKTKGVKAPILGGTIFMYLFLFAISLGGWYGLQEMSDQTDPNSTMGVNIGLQALTSWFSGIFTAGLMLMGIRRALEQRVSWKMVFAGFSKALTITIALVLQLILITIGFVLLVLPGIYLSVGYALTLPLILEKDLGPWEALEASRKAIHKKWWTVFGLYLVMMLLISISTIPLGLGLIWTLPMFFVLIGILYVRLFGSDEIMGGEIEDEESESEEEKIEDAVEEEQEVVSEESR